MRLLLVTLNRSGRTSNFAGAVRFPLLAFSVTPSLSRVLQANRKILACLRKIGRSLVFAHSPTCSWCIHPVHQRHTPVSHSKLPKQVSVLPRAFLHIRLRAPRAPNIRHPRITRGLCPEQRATSSSPPTRFYTHFTMGYAS